jgi:hypothetical protein
VGGALGLDPLAFESAFNGGASPTGIFIWIPLIAGLSLMLGQSVILFANRVKPARFVVSIFAGAIKFILDVLVYVFVVWIIANWVGAKPWDFWQVARAIALASAPYWLGIFILVPYLGLIWERLLKIYVFLALLVAVQTIFNLQFFQALTASGVVWAVSFLVTILFGKLLTPLTDRLARWIGGDQEISNMHQIYEMFARHNQISE